jgi:hypothetical protein
MRIELRVVGDWRADSENVLEVCLSAAYRILSSVSVDQTLPVLLEPSSSEDDSPIALVGRSPRGERRILLPVRENHWARFGFQFAHEFAHHLADTSCLPQSHFMWLEESFCEAASLFSLRAMAKQWESDPPYPQWAADAPGLLAYAEDRIRDEKHTLPRGSSFSTWLRDEQPSLAAHAGQREKNTIIAKELLRVLEDAPRRWHAMLTIHRHGAAQAEKPDIAPFLESWAAVDAESHEAVTVFARTLGYPLH